MKLKDVKYVKITDKSNYDPAKCNDGGMYSFTTEYFRDFPQDDYFTARYSTSAQLEFCSVEGLFKSCRGCAYYEQGEGCIREEHTTTEKELRELIEDLTGEEGIKIETKC